MHWLVVALSQVIALTQPVIAGQSAQESASPGPPLTKYRLDAHSAQRESAEDVQVTAPAHPSTAGQATQEPEKLCEPDDQVMVEYVPSGQSQAG